ncbi:MAG: 4Fe-4S dicluster domain-containing protein [Acidobacteriota bacterium]
MAHSDSASARWLRRLEILGLCLFLLAMGIFVASVAWSDYEITDDVLSRLADGTVQGHHQEVYFDELSRLKGQRFGSNFAFIAAVRQEIVDSNERLDGGSQIWEYDQGQYLYGTVKEASVGLFPSNARAFFWWSIVLGSFGALLYFLPGIWLEPAGIKNHRVMFSAAKSRGWIGISVGVFLIAFYIGLYFFPAYIVNWIRLADPISEALRGRAADRWFFYGTLYTIIVAVMGVRMAVNYRHNRYQLVRTASVTFFQLGFAFLIPTILETLNKPWMDMKNAWPLDYTFFYSWRIEQFLNNGTVGWIMLVWGIALAVLVVPALAAFFGKRWYCSWVCGCGGLAETLGDPYRHLSDKSLKAWRVERWVVHGVLVFAVVMTAVVLINFFSSRQGDPMLGAATQELQSAYGFFIGSIFAGVVGTGFYPFMGNRVWCRFGCPLAAILGLVQRFKSRFRITTNGGQCISCGNCSTYCEMGIDVRWYAQRGTNIVRSSCVGCGICAAVCPRGVLRLENGPNSTPETDRFQEVNFLDIGKGRVEVS